ncbi:hypothetical protein GCM10007140_03730 [Priestia taiwanensis]|uniref:Spore coat protein n=2 Tax=Priestia taiwanensis TaxID=1347902 RepID=A0A917AL77_9BACI|nr:hypothetical protein GCM10007140_03730 [Priestia taiwanensis]
MMPSNHPYDTQPQGHASMPSAYQQPEVQPSPYQQQAYAQEGHGMMHDQQSNGKNPFHVYMPQEQSVPFFPPDGPNFQALGGMGPQFPYPVQPNQNGKKEPSQFQNMLAQFKASDGNYDINKMMNTAGTVMNTMNQLSGMVKQVGAFFSVK